MALDLVQTLSDLIAIPSVNPMGRDLSGPEIYEHRVTAYLEKLFQRLDLPFERQQVAPLRDNIIARLDGSTPPSAGGAVLLLEAHQDTVPADGMTIDPFVPIARDGRIYGRGACDIKGGMTAMLGALARLAAERPPGMPTILMACTVNEEHGYSGAAALAELWSGRTSSIFSRRPDGAVVAEPTGLDVVVAHKGAVRWRCHTRGRACHSSEPHLGDNAIYKMARVVTALEAYQREVLPQLGSHRLCGLPTMSVGTIRGGLSVNTVPDECTIEIDRRLLPGESSTAAYRDVVDFVARHGAVDFEPHHDPPFLDGATLADDHNGPLAERLAAAASEVVGQANKVGVPYGTNASKIAASGVPAVVFGPGSIHQAHTADEWLPLDELTQASEVLYRFARAGL